MVKSNLLLLLLLMLSIACYGQALSKTSIIYESKKFVVMNDGKEYKVIKETPLYDLVADTSVPLKHTINGETLILNRVLLIKEGDTKKELIEWVKGRKVFYELREPENSK